MTDSVTCPQCGKTASGNFCASCGASLGGRFCTQCGAKATPGATFCTECGAQLGGAPNASPPPAATPARPSPGPRSRASAPRKAPPAPTASARSSGGEAGASSNAAWWVGGAMMVVVILFMVVPLVTGGEEAPTPNAPFASGGGGAAGGPGAVDLSSMTPRQAADRLFDRVMRAASANNDQEVSMFLPMAVQAYDMLETLDPDAYYHKALLQLTGTFNQEALDAAQAGLELYPDHLLNLYAAGSAELALGDTAAAREYLTRLLEVYDQEMASGNLDYEAHAQQMGTIREFAETNTGG